MAKSFEEEARDTISMQTMYPLLMICQRADIEIRGLKKCIADLEAENKTLKSAHKES